MTPEPITTRTGINRLGAVLCSVFALLPLYFAVDLTRFFWQFNNVATSDWVLVGVLYGVAAAIVLFCIWLWRKPQWRGAWVTFRDDGFDVRIRTIWGGEHIHSLQWSEVESVRHVELPRGASYVALRLHASAALRSGMIQPTTRKDPPTLGSPREVKIGIALVDLRGAEIVERFEQSAENAGFALERVTALNVVAYERYVWNVVYKT